MTGPSNLPEAFRLLGKRVSDDIDPKLDAMHMNEIVAISYIIWLKALQQ